MDLLKFMKETHDDMTRVCASFIYQGSFKREIEYEEFVDIDWKLLTQGLINIMKTDLNSKEVIMRNEDDNPTLKDAQEFLNTTHPRLISLKNASIEKRRIVRITKRLVKDLERDKSNVFGCLDVFRYKIVYEKIGNIAIRDSYLIAVLASTGLIVSNVEQLKENLGKTLDKLMSLAEGDIKSSVYSANYDFYKMIYDALNCVEFERAVFEKNLGGK